MATSGLPLLNNVLWTLGLDLEHPHPDTTANRTGAPRSRTAKENRDRVKKRVGKMMKKVRSSAGLKGLGREKKGEEKNKLRGARSFANLKGLEDWEADRRHQLRRAFRPLCMNSRLRIHRLFPLYLTLP